MNKAITPATAPGKPPARAAGSDRGERTREQILRATLEIIAIHGLSGASHRAIAARAGVRLSLTSYHFGTLDELLAAAFDTYHAHTEPRRAALVAQVEERVARFLARPAEATPLAVAEQLSDILAQYVHEGARAHRTDLAVECNFLFAWNLSPALRHKVEQHSTGLVRLAGGVFARMGSGTPEVDSTLLLACIRQLEFTQVSSGELMPVADLKLQLFRLLLGLLTVRQQPLPT